MTVLLKECRDIQLRGSSSGHDTYDNAVMVHAESDAENVISEHLVSWLCIFLQHGSLNFSFSFLYGWMLIY